MRNLLFVCFVAVVLISPAFGQSSPAPPAWKVTLPQATKAPSTITVQNRCQSAHSFKLEKQSVPFLELGQSQVQVAGGQNQVVPVTFNTFGLSPQVFQGQVLVVCLTCGSEPTCTQDREILPVVLTVSPAADEADGPPRDDDGPVPAGATKKDPCESIDERCEDLKEKAHMAEARAAGSQDTADAARRPADEAAGKAADADQAAKDAGEAAKDDPSDYKANVDGQEYSSADVAYRVVLQNEINRAQRAGEISVAEHKSQTEANTTKNAREQRLKNKEKLADEARIAGEAAAKAKAAAEEAKRAADAAQDAADAAKAEAEAARRAYDNCVDKINDECNKIKAEAARVAAEIKKAADAEAAKKKAEEDKEKAGAARAKALIEKDKYLVDNIQKLGLIDSRLSRKDAASIYQWLPTWLQTPVALLAEASTQTPIPVDTLQAFARLYGLAGSLLDPCTWGGKQKTIARLNGMVNPNTGLKYTDGEAVTKMADMCDLFKRMRAKLEAVKKAQQTR